MIVIIGAGICGLGIGWQLAKAGRRVTVLERGEAGRATSWAAAGMLAPQVEAEPGEETLLPLLLESRALWAEFAAELEGDSEMAVDYRTEGTLVVSLDRDDQPLVVEVGLGQHKTLQGRRRQVSHASAQWSLASPDLGDCRRVAVTEGAIADQS